MIYTLVLSFFFSYFSHGSAPGANPPQIEELFIEKAAQELKLKGETRSRFVSEVKKLGERKRRIRQEMSAAIEKMQDGEFATLNEYSQALGRLNQFRLEEFRVVRDLLGDEKTREYLIFKNKIHNRLKELIAARDVNEL